ncbi:MAG: hypothetical protein K8M05_26315, partial [Deltaproteobacteria bacterium]|nr:hypothetical protein [Kofleriaceae bacterium]
MGADHEGAVPDGSTLPPAAAPVVGDAGPHAGLPDPDTLALLMQEDPARADAMIAELQQHPQGGNAVAAELVDA